MPLQKQVVQIPFGATEQKTGARLLPPTKLVTAENVYQDETRVYRKRNGHGVYATACDQNEAGTTTAALTVGKGIAATTGELVLRAGQNAYVYDNNVYQWAHRGTVDTTSVTTQTLIPTAGYGCCWTFDTNTYQLWTFGLSEANGTPWFSVYDVQTDQMIVPASPIPGLTAGTTTMMRCDYYGSGATQEVYLYRVTTTPVVAITTFTIANARLYASGASTPTTATLWNPGGGAAIYGIDMIPQAKNTAGTAGAAIFFVVGNALTIGGAPYVGACFEARAGTVNTISGTNFGGGVAPRWCCLAKNSASSYIGGVYAVGTPGGGVARRYYAVKFSNTTMALSAGPSALNAASPTTELRYDYHGCCWVDGATIHALVGDMPSYTYGAGTPGATAVYSIWDHSRIDYAYNDCAASSGGTNDYILGGWIASDPVSIGSRWHVVIGHGANSDGTQNSYYFFRVGALSDGAITDKVPKARWLYGRGGFPSFNGMGTGSTYLGRIPGPSPVFSWGNTYYALCQEQVAGDGQGVALIDQRAALVAKIDTAVTTGPSVVDQDGVIMPSAWAQRYAVGAMSELAPPMYPRWVYGYNPGAGASGLAGGDYSYCACYAVYGSDGRLYRSAPSPVAITTVVGAAPFNIDIPALRLTSLHGLPGTAGMISRARVVIEVYMTAAGGSTYYLLGTVDNPTTTDVAIYTVTDDPVTTAEVLYTTGGALDNSAPPPAKIALAWSDRVFLTGTDEPGVVWVSQVAETGYGRRYNELLNFVVSEGAGDITAAGVVDDNVAAFFKLHGIWGIRGQGPDALGIGSYEPFLISDQFGCAAACRTVTGPQGLFFQHRDGGIWLVDRGCNVVYVGQGVDDYRTQTVTACVHVAKQKHVRFHMSSGTILVLDYGNPTPEEPFGQWYVWTGLPVAAGACIYATVHHWVTTAGAVYYESQGAFVDGTSTPFLPKLKTAPIRFAGVQGFGRVYRVQFIGSYVGAHTIKFTLETDDATYSQSTSKAMSAGPEEFEVRPTYGKCSDMQITIEQTGTGTTDAFTAEGLALEIGVKPGLKRLNTTQRI